MENNKADFQIVDDKGNELKVVSLPLSPILLSDDEKLDIPKKDPNYLFVEYVEDIIEDIKENKKILLVGHTGTGKTSVFDQIASRINQPRKRVNLNDQTTISDLVGYLSVEAGNVTFKYGILPTAMKKGYWIILDEIDYCEPGIAGILNAVLEGQPLVLKENGNESIIPHPNFRILATANSVGCMQEFRHLYMGTKIMNDAFIDRFRVYHVPYLMPEQELIIARNTFINYYQMKYNKLSPEKINSNSEGITHLCSKMVKGANSIRILFEKGELDNCTFSTRRLIDWIESTVRHKDPQIALKNSVLSKISFTQQDIIKNYINIELPTKEDVTQIFLNLESDYKLESPKQELEKIQKIIKNNVIESKVQTGLSRDDIEKALQQNSSAMTYIDKFSKNTILKAKECRELYINKKSKYLLTTTDLENYVEEILKSKKNRTNETALDIYEKVFKTKLTKSDFVSFSKILPFIESLD